MLKENINGYALALFSIAIEEKNTTNMKDDANAVIEVVVENESITHLLSSKTVEVSIKDKLVDKAFVNVNDFIKNFIKLVFSKGLGQYIVPALEKFIKLINEKDEIKEGVIFTTEKLTPNEIKKVELKVQSMLGFKPSLKNRIDPDLIAGFRVVVNDEVIEDSVISRLAQLKNELLESEGN